jgi:hypothetical protein
MWYGVDISGETQGEIIPSARQFLLPLRWGETVSVEMRPLTDPLSIPQMIHEWIWSSGGMTLSGENRRTRLKTCPITSLSTANPTWTDLGANLGLRGEKPATNRLSYGRPFSAINFQQYTLSCRLNEHGGCEVCKIAKHAFGKQFTQF